MRYVILYHLYNFKNVKNTHGGVLILVKLQASALYSKSTQRKIGYSKDTRNGTWALEGHLGTEALKYLGTWALETLDTLYLSDSE